ncbi:MAG TPA: response regulator [Steroidobacteraceae bacterium]|nr:response regulator [Steroidobacteraceae bacterium]
MSTPSATLFIVDDDEEVRRSLARLLRSVGYMTRAFSSAADFLVNYDSAGAGCIILDLAMPGLSGLELQQCLSATGCHRPIIFLTGNGDITTSVRAMKAGAVNFLTKPVDDRDLFAAVEEALAIDIAERAAWRARHSVYERLATLTPRERQVMEHVVAGRLNKQVAGELGTAEKTVKVHRARVMRKMRARSLAELVKLAGLVGIQSADSSELEQCRH